MDLVKFIEQGKQSMEANIKDPTQLPTQLIMILGMSGTGKSTLVNYLNGVPLVCKDESQRTGLCALC
jgi:ABC-type proline/glycine betaine transport system ATPase subunit